VSHNPASRGGHTASIGRGIYPRGLLVFRISRDDDVEEHDKVRAVGVSPGALQAGQAALTPGMLPRSLPTTLPERDSGLSDPRASSEGGISPEVDD
jgi:hypothetical protein